MKLKKKSKQRGRITFHFPTCSFVFVQPIGNRTCIDNTHTPPKTNNKNTIQQNGFFLPKCQYCLVVRSVHLAPSLAPSII